MSQSWTPKLVKVSPETIVAANETGSRGERPSTPVEASPYLAGEVIGDRYRLVRELGRGGMGVVWVGHALALGVEVAVKLIHASAAGPALSSRMAREAHAAARLGHPALVRVFDFGWTSRGDPYLVMELVQGETLSACLAREGRISAIRAVQMLLPVADGVRLAHDRTIVHRDIKPDNIFLATDPLSRVQPKLLDFGIAKVGPGNVDGKLTQVGVVLGSPEYMSPEQALGAEDVGEQTDVWSLAVVLYELVTGTVPFKKPNYNALMQAIIHDPVKPMTDFGGADESLWQVVSKGLCKDRSERWPSMAEFGEALALWLYEHGIKEDICGNSIRAVWLDGGHLAPGRKSIPTIPAAQRLADTAARKHNSAAKTIQRMRASRAPELARFLAQKRVIASAVVLGAIVGGLIAVLLLRDSSERNPAVNARSEEALGVAAGAVASAGISGRPASTPGEERSEPQREPLAVSAESLPKEGGAANAAGRERGSTQTPSTAKSGSKTAKRRHDFGF